MSKPTLAVIGGTGEEGSGLALRWAAAGYSIVIGSRSAEKADKAAQELSEQLPAGSAAITGAENAKAAAAGDLVILSVPYDAQRATIDGIKAQCQGKIVVTVVAPVKPPKVSHVWRPEAGSAAQEAQEQLGEAVKVVAAFQNVSASHLKDLEHAVDCDILVTGDDKAAKAEAIALAHAAGLYGIDAGPLVNASVVEGLTALLIGINIRHKVKGSGIRITNIPRENSA